QSGFSGDPGLHPGDRPVLPVRQHPGGRALRLLRSAHPLLMSTIAPLPPAPHLAGSLVLAARQFPRHRAAVVGLVVLVLICLAAILAPLVAPYDPVAIKLSAKLKPPSFEHWLGTDHFGRDVFSRMVYGGRTSLTVGLLVVGFAFCLGVPLGLAS